MRPYQDEGPVFCDEDFDISSIKGKTVVITGGIYQRLVYVDPSQDPNDQDLGAKSIGVAYVKAMVKAGYEIHASIIGGTNPKDGVRAHVTFGDVDEESGRYLESSLQGGGKFVKCDVTSWDDQLDLFKVALTTAPNGRIDIVVANAGIGSSDDLYITDTQQEHPTKPSLAILNVNLTGAIYTTKLALHYFRRQHALNPAASKDQLLVLQGSISGYLDITSSLQYNVSKFSLRALMRSLRYSETQHGIRVNCVCPWFTKTSLLTPEMFGYLERMNVQYATAADAALALLKLASNSEINGRSLGVFPRTRVDCGYIDMESDDYDEGDVLKPWDNELARLISRGE